MSKRFDLNLKLPLCTDNPTGTDIYAFGDTEKAQHVENTGIERQGGITNLYEQDTVIAPQPSSSGLQASWPLNGDGTDVSGNGRTLTTLQNVEYASDGGGSNVQDMYFRDRSVTRAAYGAAINASAWTAISIAWEATKPESAATEWLWSFGTYTVAGFQAVFLTGTNTLELTFDRAGSDEAVDIPNVADATLRKFVFTFDLPSKAWILYRDGAVFANGTLANAPVMPNYKFVIGNRDSVVTGATWVGLIGKVRLYNRVLTPAEVALSASSTMIAKDGTVVQVDSSNNVLLDGKSIGNVGPLSVSMRGKIPGYSDAAWTADNTIVGILRVGNAIQVDEYDPATRTVTHTRQTTFALPPAIIINVILVKYVGMHWADSLRFILSNNLASYLLTESGTTTSQVAGITWTSQSVTADLWNGVAWSPTIPIFVSVGAGGAGHNAMSSPDGVTWTNRTLEANSWQSVCWSPDLGKFVAVGGGATHYAATSTDGINWSTQTLAAGNWLSVCWSSQLGLFVAVSNSTNYAASSPDGVTWNVRSLEANSWRAVCWSGTKFVAVGTGATHYAATSTDGVNWNTQTSTLTSANGVTWSPALGLFVAAGGGATNNMASSTDGVTWILHSAPNATYRPIAWIPQMGIFVAAGGGAQAVTSTDGINWYLSSAGFGNAVVGITNCLELNKLVIVGNTITYTGVLAGNINFAWQFSATNCLVGQQGTSGSWLIGDIASTSMTNITDATWVVIDLFAGTSYSQAILTFPVKKNLSGLLTGIGTVGYSQAGVYSATPVYYGVALGAVTITIGTHAEGPGYSEATFTRSDTGTNIYYYQAPIMGHQPGQFYDYQQCQTQTQINGYGRLSDFNNNTAGNTVSLRVVMINGVPSFLSGAALGQTATAPIDCLGVTLTNVGEFDEFYVPHVVDNGTARLNVIYRWKGILFYIVIQSGVANGLSRVSENVYLVNCLSPANVIDVAARQLMTGVNDYNGRMLFRSSGSILGSSAQAVTLIQGRHANSVDTGAKLNTITFSTTSIIIPGIALPSFIDRAISDFGVNLYYAAGVPVYNATYYAFNVTATNSNYTNVLYFQDTRDPVAMGYAFYDKVMQTEVETIFMGVGITGSADIDFDYLCYEQGNQVSGQYLTFELFAQRYLFDGKAIWLASFDGSLFNGKGNAPVASATGLTFIAAAPTMAFFLSSFDNSIYIFNGGHSVEKFKRMNDEEAIVSGAYSVRDNEMLLITANTFLWVRDGVVTRNTRKANQTSISAYDTTGGIVIANNTMKWVYSYDSTGSTSVVALNFQSAFFGALQEMATRGLAFLVTLYSPSKAQADIRLSCPSFDADLYSTQTENLRILPGDWNALGLYRCRIQPRTESAVGASVGVYCESKIIITGITMEYGESVPAVPRSGRSK